MPVRPHFEPFVHLAGLTHDDVLIAWGGFWFIPPEGDGQGPWEIVEDPDLASEGIDRRESIGARSEPYGEATVEVTDLSTGRVVARASTDAANHVWVRGLEPSTDYRYSVDVGGRRWAGGPTMRAEPLGDGRFRLTAARPYDNRFRTFPAPDERAAVTFAVLGDYGVGILASEGNGERQLEVARALERAVDHHGVSLVVTTGDNIYLGDEDTVAGSGRHDDDWYFSFYEPYRHVINRVPVYPAIGNHDSSDTEESDDRGQIADNLFTELRFASEAEVGRSSIDPGLFYRFDVGADVEMVAIDTTLASDLDARQYFEAPNHVEFLEEAFPAAGHSPGEPHPRWRIPFCHHPAFCAGPSHPNHEAMIETLLPLFQRAGVRLVLSGHEHNFQLSHHEGITYVVTGAGGKVRAEPPERFAEAHTVAWGAAAHFLLITLDGEEGTLLPVRDVDDDGGLILLDAVRPDGTSMDLPVRLRSTLEPPGPEEQWSADDGEGAER